MRKPEYLAPIDRLAKRINEDHDFRQDFQDAIDAARASGVTEIQDIKTTEDYLRECEVALRKPIQKRLRVVFEDTIKLYYVLYQEPLAKWHSPISPCSDRQDLTELSKWIVDFVRAWGDFFDTLESVKLLDTLEGDPDVSWDDFMPPPGGYLTFNQFFARHVKPGKRPVAALSDHTVIVSPADSQLAGIWEIGSDLCIEAKGIKWSIRQLLADSVYSTEFEGGIFTHSFLGVYDYHRFHAPVSGRVVEAKKIEGQASFEVIKKERADADGKLLSFLQVPNDTGYQFIQMRGLVVLDTPVGLVAILPIGMGNVSSVVLTADIGADLRKGEELGYFQFGGSDIVMVFQKKSKVEISSEIDQHVLQGQAIGVSLIYDQ